MAAYIYGDYIYFENMIDTPNEDHNKLVLNQIPDFLITSPSKLMDETFESLPKLFVDRMQKKNDEFAISKLRISYQNSMYGTKRIDKWNKCITKERK